MSFSLCTLYTVSPMHAGSGASLSAVDLPIQRERHTGWPHVQSSGVKGAFRDHFRHHGKIDGTPSTDEKLINLIFGFDKQDDERSTRNDTYPGVVAFSDAKLFAFPVRSNVAPFVWVTCPAILKRFKTDLAYTGKTFNVPEISVNKEQYKTFGELNVRVQLEDALVGSAGPVGSHDLGQFFKDSKDIDRLLLVHDEVFDYCVTTCTEIQTNIKIDSKTGTAVDGALRYQEFLPADSLLYIVVNTMDSQMENSLKAEQILTFVKTAAKDFIQIGGDESLGKGICKIDWM